MLTLVHTTKTTENCTGRECHWILSSSRWHWPNTFLVSCLLKPNQRHEHTLHRSNWPFFICSIENSRFPVPGARPLDACHVSCDLERKKWRRECLSNHWNVHNEVGTLKILCFVWLWTVISAVSVAYILYRYFTPYPAQDAIVVEATNQL